MFPTARLRENSRVETAGVGSERALRQSAGKGLRGTGTPGIFWFGSMEEQLDVAKSGSLLGEVFPGCLWEEGPEFAT